MNILHISDLHGHWELILNEKQKLEQSDIIVFTGDMLPDLYNSSKRNQQQYQFKWVKQNSNFKSVVKLLETKSVIIVNGNHDYINLANYIPNSFHITEKQTCVINGVKFAGFEGMPYCGGGFNQELSDLEIESRARAALNHKPDILLTHVPPAGMLDEGKWGLIPLRALIDEETSLVTYKVHLFGHCHYDGNKRVLHKGVEYINGACCVNLLHLDF